MNSEVEKKINNFRDLCVTLCEDPAISNVINMMDNQTLYNMINDLYLKLNVTKEQAFDELTTKLKLSLNEETTTKIKRYIDYFYEIMETKYSNTSYDELLKLI